MPFFFQYLVKFSLSLAVLYTFYYVVLRPLTFYQWNRFYLLCYLLLSFIFPFVNITKWIPAENRNAGSLINSIPVVEKLAFHPSSRGARSILYSATIWDVACVLFLIGASIMLIRIVYQYLSLRSMKRRAVLLKTGDFEFYDVNAAINPFSFANAIFINSRLHTEEEFHRILEHEFVHVKQKHTIDIVLAELVCILNWFNPFAWMIRKAIRQNLEFIADHNVLEGGIDPRQYQYLLLKVMGLPQYSIANNFSFSSLKKRITMMNKMKTARVHLVKFLFVLPLLAVVLLAFRDKINFQKDGLMLTYAGLVVNSENYQPLKNVWIKELNTKIEIQTDANGYFKLSVPAKDYKTNLRVHILKDGILKREVTVKWTAFKPEGSESFIGFVGIDISPTGAVNCEKCFAYQDQALDKNGLFVEDLSYETVSKKFSDYIRSTEDVEAIMKSKTPIVRIKDKLYVIGGVIPGTSGEPAIANSTQLFSLQNVERKPDFYVNGLLTSSERINATINRAEIKDLNHLKREEALRKYGKNEEAIEISTYSGVGMDTVPQKRIAPPAALKEPAEPIDSINSSPSPPPPVPPTPSVTPVKPKKVTISVAPVPAVTTPITPIPPVLAADPTDTTHGSLIRIIKKNATSDPLYVVDGKVLPPGKSLEKVDPDSISSIAVTKGPAATALYGGKAINGVIQITTKAKARPLIDEPVSKSKIYIKNIDDIKGLIIVDGIQISKEKLFEIDGNTIKSINVLKGDSATELYKEKGKDGVIIITTK